MTETPENPGFGRVECIETFPISATRAKVTFTPETWARFFGPNRYSASGVPIATWFGCKVEFRSPEGLVSSGSDAVFEVEDELPQERTRLIQGTSTGIAALRATARKRLCMYLAADQTEASLNGIEF